MSNNNMYCNKMYWHPYTNCGDAPKVAEYQTEVFLCKVQRFNKETNEPVGAPSHQVCVCDDNGMFFGMRSDGLNWAKVIAWTDIVETKHPNHCEHDLHVLAKDEYNTMYMDNDTLRFTSQDGDDDYVLEAKINFCPICGQEL